MAIHAYNGRKLAFGEAWAYLKLVQHSQPVSAVRRGGRAAASSELNHSAGITRMGP